MTDSIYEDIEFSMSMLEGLEDLQHNNKSTYEARLVMNYYNLPEYRIYGMEDEDQGMGNGFIEWIKKILASLKALLFGDAEKKKDKKIQDKISKLNNDIKNGKELVITEAVKNKTEQARAAMQSLIDEMDEEIETLTKDEKGKKAWYKKLGEKCGDVIKRRKKTKTTLNGIDIKIYDTSKLSPSEKYKMDLRNYEIIAKAVDEAREEMKKDADNLEKEKNKRDKAKEAGWVANQSARQYQKLLNIKDKCAAVLDAYSLKEAEARDDRRDEYNEKMRQQGKPEVSEADFILMRK